MSGLKMTLRKLFLKNSCFPVHSTKDGIAFTSKNDCDAKIDSDFVTIGTGVWSNAKTPKDFLNGNIWKQDYRLLCGKIRFNLV